LTLILNVLEPAVLKHGSTKCNLNTCQYLSSFTVFDAR
jgi:hypothetical protein